MSADEQITKTPEVVEKIKDPKKVAAGKRLSEYHKKAKKALIEKTEESTHGGWMPEISFTTALSIVGIVLTAVDLYYRWKSSSERRSERRPEIKSAERKYVEDEPPKKRIGWYGVIYMIIYIEVTKPDFTIYLDPPVNNPKTISILNARVGIPSSITPPSAVYVYCDLVDNESVRFATMIKGVAKRKQLLGIIHQKKANQISSENYKVIAKANGNIVYSIVFKVTDGDKLLNVSPEKIYLEIEIC